MEKVFNIIEKNKKSLIIILSLLTGFVLGAAAYIVGREFIGNNSQNNKVEEKTEQTANKEETSSCSNNTCSTEIREKNNKENSSTNSSRCWNKVISYDDKYAWPNGCRGDPNAEMCTLVITELNQEEKQAYEKWVQEGKKLENLDPKCKS